MNQPKSKIDVSHIKSPLLPRYDRVLVIPHQPSEKVLDSGIIKPVTVSEGEQLQWGHVLKVGPGKPGEPIALEEGELIAYMKGAGTPLEWERQKFIYLRDVDVIGNGLE